MSITIVNENFVNAAAVKRPLRAGAEATTLRCIQP
jgi:hypothetical protein